MMKFVAVLLVAAVFAVSVVDARHHGLVKRDANCVLNPVGPVENLLDGVLIYVNDLKTEVLDALTIIVNLEIFAIRTILALLNQTCVNKYLDEIRLLPQFILDTIDECITKAIEEARKALHAVLDPVKDNLEVLCYLQECIGTGIVACIAQLTAAVGATVLALPAALVTVIRQILPILKKLLDDVVACINIDDLTAALRLLLNPLLAIVKKCPRF